MQQPLFITGNQHKADYLARMLGMALEHRKIDLVEIQSSSPKEVVRHKVREAYEIAQQPVLVEDVSLGFAALNGLPGPFIKYFVEAPDGIEKLCRMLDGFDDRSALVTMMATRCTFFAVSYLVVSQRIRVAMVALAGIKYFAQMATMAGRALSYCPRKMQRHTNPSNQLQHCANFYNLIDKIFCNSYHCYISESNTKFIHGN